MSLVEVLGIGRRGRREPPPDVHQPGRLEAVEVGQMIGPPGVRNEWLDLQLWIFFFLRVFIKN